MFRFKPRKAKKPRQPGNDEWSVVGYSAAESFDIIGLQQGYLIFIDIPSKVLKVYSTFMFFNILIKR